MLDPLIRAETEWILKQMAVQQAESISDHDFESALARSVNYQGEPNDPVPASIKKALAGLRQAEQRMSTPQVAAERREILKFFQN